MYVLIFEQKQLDFFLMMKNCQYFATNIFSITNCDKFGHFCAKKQNRTAGNAILKFSVKKILNPKYTVRLRRWYVTIPSLDR